MTLQQLGYQTIMVNYNPETVSTDYDECDRLYFEELSWRRVCDDLPAREARRRGRLDGRADRRTTWRCSSHEAGRAASWAPRPSSIDTRRGPAQVLGAARQPRHRAAGVEGARSPSRRRRRSRSGVGYPVLVRPSYVLSGAAMGVASNDARAGARSSSRRPTSRREHPVVISKFIENAKELEIDARGAATASCSLTRSPSTSRTRACIRATRRWCCRRSAPTWRPCAASGSIAAQIASGARDPRARSTSSSSPRTTTSRSSSATCAPRAASRSCPRCCGINFIEPGDAVHHGRAGARSQNGVFHRPGLRRRQGAAVLLHAPRRRRPGARRRDGLDRRGRLPGRRLRGGVPEGAALGGLPPAGAERAALHRARSRTRRRS